MELACSEWITKKDTATNHVYYVHKRTRESRWAPPGDDDADELIAEQLRGSAVSTSPAVGTSKTPPQHSESPVCTVEELFRAVDVDGSGDISFEELAKFWTGRQHAVGKHDDATIAQMRSIFDDLDEDGSGAQCH